jgi:uncharacterized protein (TIGR03086 family)
MDYRPLDRRALDLAGEVIAQVPRERLGDPTPCSPWTVRDLLKHMVSANLRFAAAVRGDDPDAACAPDEADLGDDPAASFRGSAKVVTEAFGVPDLADRRLVLEELPGPMPAAVAVGFHVTDVFVHGWDVAVATGVPFTPPEDLTAAVLDRASRIPDAGRAPGGPFGLVVEAGSGDTELARLLGLVGRDPGWTSA